MFFNRVSKSLSEDNIPLMVHRRMDESLHKHHKLVKSDLPSYTPELDGFMEDEDVILSSERSTDDSREINNLQAIIHIVKCSIGTGILALPSALRYCGYAFGLTAIFFISLVNIYSMHLLLAVIEYVRSKHPKEVLYLDYERTVKLCFELATEKIRKYSWVHHVLLVCIGCAQIGFLSSYHVFVADNTKSLVDYYVSERYRLSIWIYQLAFFFLLTPLLFFKNLVILSYLCQLANVLIALGLTISVVYCFTDPIPIKELKAIHISDATFLFFGIVIFSFESINIINVVENNLKIKKNMSKKLGVVNLSFCIIVPISLIVGFSGYWKFGENISSSIILSIPIKPWYLMLCKPLYIISIFISYSLQGFIFLEIIGKKLKIRLNTEKKKRIGGIIARISVGLSITILSISIPHFDLLVSLVGALTGSAIILLFPAMSNSVMIYTTKNGRYWKIKLFTNALVFAFGVIGCIVGTYTSIFNIIKTTNT